MIKKIISFLLLMLFIVINAAETPIISLGEQPNILPRPSWLSNIQVQGPAIISWGWLKSGTYKSAIITVKNFNANPAIGKADPNGVVISLHVDLPLRVNTNVLKAESGPYTQSLSNIVEYKTETSTYTPSATPSNPAPTPIPVVVTLPQPANGGETKQFEVFYTVPSDAVPFIRLNSALSFIVTDKNGHSWTITSPTISYGIDNVPPSKPVVDVTKVTHGGDTYLSVKWQDCVDNSGAYNVRNHNISAFVNGVRKISQWTSRAFTVSEFPSSPCTRYDIFVTVYDLAGNSSQSDKVSFIYSDGTASDIVLNTNLRGSQSRILIAALNQITLLPGFEYRDNGSISPYFRASIKECNLTLKSATTNSSDDEIYKVEEEEKISDVNDVDLVQNTDYKYEYVPDVEIEVYPIPSKDVVNIQITGIEVGNSSYELINSTGTTISSGIISSNATPVNISEVLPGVYNMKIKLNDYIINKKVIKSN